MFLATQPFAVPVDVNGERLEQWAVAIADLSRAVEDTVCEAGGTVLGSLQGQIGAFWEPTVACPSVGEAVRQATMAASRIQVLAASAAVEDHDPGGTEAPVRMAVALAADWAVIRPGQFGRPMVVGAAISKATAAAIAMAGLRMHTAVAAPEVETLRDDFERIARLASLEPAADLVRLLACAGQPLETWIIARLIGRSVAQVERELAGLGCCEALVRHGPIETVQWQVADPEMAATVERSVLVKDRRAIHSAIATALEERLDGRVPTRLARRVAEHRIESGDAHAALHWWHRGAASAVFQSDPFAAVECLRQAAALVDRSPGIAPIGEQIAILRLLAAQLGSLRGNAAPEVALTYQRCLELARSIPENAGVGLFDLMWGAQACLLVRGSIGPARELSRHLVELAERSTDDACRVSALRMKALTELLAADLDAARRSFHETLAIYRSDMHASLRFRFVSDQRALALVGLAWTETIAGRSEMARLHARSALETGAELDHPHTSAHVHGVLALNAQLAGDEAAAANHAAITTRISIEHGFGYWRSWADILHARLTATRDVHEARQLIAQALANYAELGAGQAAPYGLLLKSEIELMAGELEQAETDGNAALAAAGPAGVALFRPLALLQLARCLHRREGQSTRALVLARCAHGLATQMQAGLFATRVAAEMLAWQAGISEPAMDVARTLRDAMR